MYLSRLCLRSCRRFVGVYCRDINGKTIRLSAECENTLLTTKGTQLGFVLLSNERKEAND